MTRKLLGALPLPAPEAPGAGEPVAWWVWNVTLGEPASWDTFRDERGARKDADRRTDESDDARYFEPRPLYAHPTPPRAEGVEAFVVFHRGCGDEPGPASCPFEVEFRDEDGDQDAEISAVAFLSREDAESARNAFWPDGEVRAMRLLAAEAAERKKGGE